MSPKIFITGGTGYIGGSVLHTLATSHPSYSITALLRTIPPTFTTTYPHVTIVQGDYDSSALLTSEASKADIVIHNGNSDHETSLNALVAGLLQKDVPGYLLHLSGTGIVSDWADTSHLGRLNPRIWSDTSSLEEMRALPQGALHRNTEMILHSTIREHADKINIAVMCPPDIYGRGMGLVRTTSALVPMYISTIRELDGKVFYHREGTNTRSWVHISDLTRLYMQVVDAAVSNSRTHFNSNGYFFASTQEHSQIELARATGRILKKHGIVQDEQPVSIELEDLDAMANPYPLFPNLARYLYASNSRTRSDRAREVFGYKAEAPGLLETLESDVLDALK